MSEFRAGNVDVLVATTVIEVGVDVPNATVMVVEDAERFGLLQLHQLRGRVGRGAHASACYLLADPGTPQGEARMEAMVHSTDGFELAERDLAIRGAGEVFGQRQAGWTDLKLGRLPAGRAHRDRSARGRRARARRRSRPRAARGNCAKRWRTSSAKRSSSSSRARPSARTPDTTCQLSIPTVAIGASTALGEKAGWHRPRSACRSARTPGGAAFLMIRPHRRLVTRPRAQAA